MADTYIKVGRIKQAQGLKGEVFVRLFAGQADWLDQFLTKKPARLNGQDFAMDEAWLHKDGLVVKLSHLHGRTEAEKLRGFELEIPEEFLTSKPGEAIYLHELKNFTVVDAVKGSVGVVESFSSNGAQDILVLNNGSLVPLIKEFIVKIDFKEKKINMNLPEGLIEVNLTSAESK